MPSPSREAKAAAVVRAFRDLCKARARGARAAAVARTTAKRGSAVLRVPSTSREANNAAVVRDDRRDLCKERIREAQASCVGQSLAVGGKLHQVEEWVRQNKERARVPAPSREAEAADVVRDDREITYLPVLLNRCGGNPKGNPGNAGNARGNPGNTGGNAKGEVKRRAGQLSGLSRKPAKRCSDSYRRLISNCAAHGGYVKWLSSLASAFRGEGEGFTAKDWVCVLVTYDPELEGACTEPADLMHLFETLSVMQDIGCTQQNG